MELRGIADVSQRPLSDDRALCEPTRADVSDLISSETLSEQEQKIHLYPS